MLKRIGEMAYCLGLAASKLQALQGLHDLFHINLLRCYQSNRLDYEAPPLEIDGEEHYKVQAIQKHRVICGEVQYLVKKVATTSPRTFGLPPLNWTWQRKF